MKKYKLIKVDAETHVKAKVKATKDGMTLEGYIKKIVNKDTNQK